MMISNIKDKIKTAAKLLPVLLPMAVVIAGVIVIRNQQTIGSQAADHQADVSFNVASWSLPPQNTFGVWVNADSTVAFADIEISYDPSMVVLASEINPDNSLFRVISSTTMAQANSTGKISMVLGLDPASRNNAPSGAFRIANLTFAPATTSPKSATVSFMNGSMQLVAADLSVFTLNTTPLTLWVNQPIPSPTPTPTPGPTGIKTPSPTKTPVPTGTAQPKPNPTAVPGDLVISNVKALNITSNSVIIHWELNNYGTGQVEYGTTTNYGQQSTPETSFDWNYHEQPLKNLNPGTLYHFRVISANRAGVKSISGDYTFTTRESTGDHEGRVLLSGSVKSGSTGRAIKGATVSVRNNHGSLVARGRTNGSGHFAFYVAKGSYSVKVSAWGYGSKTVSADLSASKIFNFTLSRWKYHWFSRED